MLMALLGPVDIRALLYSMTDLASVSIMNLRKLRESEYITFYIATVLSSKAEPKSKQGRK